MMMMMMIMILLLFLGSCVNVGVSYKTYEKEYGKTFKFLLLSSVQSLEFVTEDSTDSTMLWTHDNPEASRDTRRKVEGIYFVIYNVTQKDNGQYILRDRYGTTTKNLVVKANTQKKTLMSGEQFSFSFKLDPKSCNIYFFPEYGLNTQKVRQGALLWGSDKSGCSGLELIEPCGISNEAAPVSCAGRFEFRDHNDNKALEVELEVQSPKFNSNYLYAGIGSVVCTILSCCLKCCCCGKSSNKESTDSDAEAEAEAADNNEELPVYYHKYDQEPVGPRPNQPTEPSEAPYPTQPSHTATDPLIHNPPTGMPPPYSEVSAPAEQTATPTFPLCSDQEPQFEVKGIDFNLDTTQADVYTSDKFNFL